MRGPNISDEQIEMEFIFFYDRYGRSPSMRETPWPFSLRANRIVKRFGGSWNKALMQFGLPIRETKFVPDTVILSELRQYYDREGKPPTHSLKPWPFAVSRNRIAERFGTWNQALAAAGITIDKRSISKAMTNENMLDALREAYKRLGRSPRYRDCPRLGLPTAPTYIRRFGSWTNSLRLAGISVDRKYYTDEELCNVLRNKAKTLGRTPKMMDFQTGQPAYATFSQHFGTWNNALCCAGFDVNLPQNLQKDKLLRDLKHVAQFIERTPTYREYDRFGQFTVRTMTRIIGASYPALVRMVGLKPIVRGELAQAVIRMASKFIGEVPEMEHRFDWLRNDITGHQLRLDAYFPKHHFAIEFDGEQHKRVVAGWGGVEGTKTRQYLDKVKSELCAKHGLPLLRIQYGDDLSPASIKELVIQFVQQHCDKN